MKEYPVIWWVGGGGATPGWDPRRSTTGRSDGSWSWWIRDSLPDPGRYRYGSIFPKPKRFKLFQNSDFCYDCRQIMTRYDGISCYLVGERWAGIQGVPLQAGLTYPGLFAGSGRYESIFSKFKFLVRQGFLFLFSFK